MWRDTGKRIALGALTLAACSGETNLVVGSDSATTVAESAEVAPTTTNGIESTRLETRGLSCPTELTEDGDFDFGDSPERLTVENTAMSTADWFMSDANSDFRLRPDDWQLLALDPGRSSDGTVFYVDGDDNAYLRLDLHTIDGTWVVGSFSSCTLVSDSGPTQTIVPAVQPSPAAADETMSVDAEGDGAPDGVEFLLPSSDPFPPDLLLSCNGFGVIDQASLAAFPPLLDDSDFPEAAAAIAPFLSSAEGEFWPQEWRLAYRGANQATLVALEDGSFSFIVIELDDGQWDFAGSSSGDGCQLEVVVDDGLNTVDFVVTSTDPASSVIVVEASERGCSSGQPVGDRLQEPRATQTDTIYLYLAAEPATGGDIQTCQTSPSTTVEIDLGEPLGEREVLDARIFGSLSDFWAE